MRPYALIYLYRRRLRAHAAQEVLAGLGVAIAVALVFAVLVANASIAGSTAQVVRTVVGPASLQLRARGPEGFDEAMLARVERLPAVRQAAPALEETAAMVGPTGRHLMLDVVGTDLSLAILDGLAHTLPEAVFSPHGVGLTSAAASELGVSATRLKEGTPQAVSVAMRGRVYRLKVSAVVGQEAAGALYQTRAALMPIESLQAISGLRGRISRILVEARPGRRAAARAELERLAAGRLEVSSAHEDVALLRQALHPADQASMFFAVIAALLGFLFAFNAMLLTVPERRQAIADLRVDGAKRTAIVQMVVFQALCLGVGASLLGLLAGYVLSRRVFHESPGYLAQTFVLGGNTVVGMRPLLLALAGGILAALLASAVPLLDLRGGRAIDAVYFEDGAPGNALGGLVQRRLFVAAVGLLAPATILFILVPPAAVVASVMLALATVFAVPLILSAVLRAAARTPTQIQRLTLLPIALTALRATTVRSLALAATGAIALFGTVALGGARADLLAALHTFARTYSAEAAVWVMNPRDTAGVVSFSPDGYAARIEHVSGVTGVRVFQSEFMNMDGRRVWVIARPASAQEPVLMSQVVAGDATRAASELRAGGWVAVSQSIAADQHARVGGIIKVPTPTGIADLRLAATTTNFGWTSGALLMNTADYSRLWATHAPTALGVDLAPGTNPTRARLAIARALGPRTGLEVITANTRSSRFGAIAEEGLSRLGEISTMLAIAAVLALVAALGSAIWERRASLSGLRLEGAQPSRLRRILLTESMLMLGAGCLTGVLAGTYGQVVIDGYLRRTTGFPVAMLATTWRPLEIFAIVVAIVLALASIPGWSASRVSSALALEAE
jgi:putative ABC transport system permease protein